MLNASAPQPFKVMEVQIESVKPPGTLAPMIYCSASTSIVPAITFAPATSKRKEGKIAAAKNLSSAMQMVDSLMSLVEPWTLVAGPLGFMSDPGESYPRCCSAVAAVAATSAAVAAVAVSP